MTSNADQTQILTEEFMNSRTALLGFVTGMMRSSRDAEDIVQESYIRLMQAKHNTAIKHPRAYVFRIVRNVAIDFVRRSSRVDRLKDAIAIQLDGSDASCTPESWLIAGEHVQQRLDAVASLPPKCRSVYAMRKFHGMSHRQIASDLGLSVRTVENHMAKATQRVQAGSIPMEASGSVRRVSADAV